MPFGNGSVGKERRKTSAVNDNFRKYLVDVLTEAVGIPVDERQAITIFKVLMRAPMRFLMTIDEKDFDQYGDRTMAVSSVGKFKIMNTIPQGRRVDLVGADGKYPRYKFYPSSSVEAEVEIINGIESDESRTVYDRTIKSEKYNLDLNVKEMARAVRKIMEEAGVSIEVEDKETNANSLGKYMTSVIKTLVNEELVKHGLVEATSEVPEDYIDEDDDIFEDIDDVDDETDVDEAPVVEKPKKVATPKAKKEAAPKKDVAPVVEPVKDEEHLPLDIDIPKPTNAVDTVAKAIDTFDFDFNT